MSLCRKCVTLQVLELGDNECVTSLVTASFEGHAEPLLVVGTAKGLSFNPRTCDGTRPFVVALFNIYVLVIWCCSTSMCLCCALTRPCMLFSTHVCMCVGIRNVAYFTTRIITV